MKDTKTEILKSFREKFCKDVQTLGGKHIYWDIEETNSQDIEQFLSTSLDQVREQTLEEVGKIIKDDFGNVLMVDKPDTQSKKNWNGIMQLSKNRMIQALTKLKGKK